ncbi:JmjC domain, hydroxylase-domain-containing protein, partial [Pyronema domesticum]
MAALVARAVEAALPESATASTTESPAVKNFEIVVPKRSAAAEEFEKVEPETESFKAVEEQEEEEEMEPIEPAYYYDDGKIPVFTPTMEQFRNFKKFVDNINHYGMESGIVKVIPPKEWTDALPPLDEKVKEIKIKNPIEQHIVGNMGEYRQTNIEKQRTYNLPEWRTLCEGSNHQPPAKRGERRKGQPTQPAKRSTRGRKSAAKDEIKVEEEDNIEKANPPTPESPVVKGEGEDGSPEPTMGRQPRMKSKCEDTPEVEAKGGRQPRQSKRRTVRERREAQELADEAAYEGFDYRMLDADQFTPERCQELEKHYWKTLTYNSPLYGADMPGSLFDDTTESWNVAKLDNLLDCLGKKLPGVNTAYLYLGMWKSTFSWHLEDMDLYSINYIHFGAPKQWYSISRKDKERFENIMRGIWPNEAKKCSQFLRHKTFLVSPSMLQQQGIKVNKLVHHQGEFVITFPFGYHSGYNIGYNCAESVNFAQRSWLEFARDAKKCECIDDAVFVDVDEIERKLRGEPTEDEYESDEDDYGYYDEDEEGNPIGVRQGDFPTPPESVEGTKDGVTLPKKRKAEGGAEGRFKKARIKIPKPPAREPCVLCPNNIPAEPLLYTENGTDQAHRLCAIYTPETYFKWDEATNREIVANVAEIPKARLELKCVFCRSKKGSCFQCSAKKCTRAYHATCAAAAGVLVNMVDVEITGEDGKTYAQTNIDYRCKIHRPKRPKDVEAEQLESDPVIRKFSAALIKDDIIQMQYFTGDIFAGVVQENRVNEETVLVKVLPRGDQLVEVEWKWILPLSSETNFPDAITTAPLYPDPSHHQRKAKVAQKDIPDAEESFGDEESTFKLGELIVGEESGLEHQEPIKAWWYYLGEQSTEYISKFTGDPKSRVADPDA